MSARVIPGALAVLLGACMLYLFLASPTQTYDGGVSVPCGSVAGAGWPEADAPGFSEDGLSDASGTLTDELRAQVAQDCADRRTTNAGAMALLAVPAALLGALALVRRR